MKQRPEYDPKIIGMNLRRLREKKHLTVEQVREYLCLGSVQAIYKYETGVGYPQADTMLALMELYEAGVNEIVKLNSEEHSSSVSIMGAYKPRRGRKGHEANNHPLCGCASKVIPKNSPSWYNDVVQASL